MAISNLRRWLISAALSLSSSVIFAGAVGDAFDLDEELGNPNDSCPGLGAGNPIHVGLGNKFQEIPVYRGVGSNPLEFTWYYNSELLHKEAWRHNLQFQMHSVAKHSTSNANFLDLQYKGKDGSGVFIETENAIITGIAGYSSICDLPTKPPEDNPEIINYSKDRAHKVITTTTTFDSSCSAIKRISKFVYSRPNGIKEVFYRKINSVNIGGGETFWTISNGFHQWNKEIHFPNGDKHTYLYSYENQNDTQIYRVDAQHSNGQSYYVEYDIYSPSATATSGEILPSRLVVGDLIWTFDYEYTTGTAPGIYVLKKINGPNNNSMEFVHQSTPIDLGGYFRHKIMLTDWLINDEHYAGWVYDNQHRAYRSYHGPHFSSSYTGSAFPDDSMSGAVELSNLDHHDIRTATNEYGKATDYQFWKIEGIDGVSKTKLTEIRGEASTNCLATNSVISYDELWRKDTITDPKGIQTQYTYTQGENARGHIHTITYGKGTPDAQTTTLVYADEDKKLIDKIYRNGLTIDYDYFPNGRLSDITYIDTTDHTLPYSTNGETRHYQFDYEYDSANADKVAKILIDGPRTDVTDISSYEYDTLGRLIAYKNALGHTTRYSNFNAWSVAETITDANGQVINLSYTDGFNQPLLSSIELVGQSPLTITYNAFELPEVVTYPNGMSFTYLYRTGDSNTLYQIENQLGQKITIDESFDTANQVKDFIIQTFDSGTSTASFDYHQVFDALGRLYQSLPHQGSIEFNYDKNNNLEWVKESGINSRGIATILQTQRTFDALDRVESVIAPGAGTTTGDYNDQNQQEGVTDDAARYTQTVYNAFGDALQVISPDSGITTHVYDAAGNIISSTDARNIKVQYTYDALNRLTAIQYPNTSENVTLTYDESDWDQQGIGRLTGITGPSGVTRFVYNRNGELTAQEWTFKGHTYVTGYAYTNGLLTTIDYPSGRQITYEYDDLGRIENVVTTEQGLPKNLITNTRYLPFGPLESFTYGNGLIQSYGFNNNYDLTALQVDDLLQLGYEYDDFGNIQTITDYIQTENDQSLKYDDASRLDEATSYYGTLLYGYNTIGNRESETHNGQLTALNYFNDSQLQSLTGAKSANYVYDAKGNMVNKNGITLNYNQASRLSSAVIGSSVTHYVYNVFNQRVFKSHLNRVYHYDALGNLIAESDATSGEFTKEYFYANNQLIALSEVSQTSPWIPIAVGDITLIIPNPQALENPTRGQFYFVHTNHLGAPVKVTDTQQGVVWEANYTPFGEATLNRATITLNIRLPGQYADAETGLYYNWHRYYAPDLGRYITSDPLGMVDGPNTYAYVQNNPVNYIDPLGLATCSYSITAHTLVCDSTLDIEGPPQRVTVGPENVFSGAGEDRNNPNSVNNKLSGPIPPGVYEMVTSEKYGGSFWLRENWFQRQLCLHLGKGRCGFFLHKGTLSDGCINVNKMDENAMQEWDRMSDMLSKERDNWLEVQY
ncbi:MAG: RHS repeat-associated core domain-containing protein [Pseudomonadota bacterium]